MTIIYICCQWFDKNVKDYVLFKMMLRRFDQ